MIPRRAFQFAAGILCLFLLFSLGSSQELRTQPPPIETMADLEALFAFEPSYGEIQQAAMRYAEVHPDKIAAWRRGASLRAFLPEVTFKYNISHELETATSTELESSSEIEYSTGFEQGYSTQEGYVDKFGQEWSSDNPAEISWSMVEENTSDVSYGWSSEENQGQSEGTNTTTGSSSDRGKEREWGIQLEWDLRDFLYNKEQRYISKEARELVELRQDVLEEVNTYFFDRRRAQIETLFSPPSDVRAKIDLQLRIARLTANIDALTGGYLSKKLEDAEATR